MFTPRVYFPDLEIGVQDAVNLVLPDEASHYLSSVLRLVAEDKIELFDGRGNYATAEVKAVPETSRGKARAKVRVWVRLTSPLKTQTRPAQALHLLQGLAMGDKMDWIIEKAVELGICRITPVQMELSTLRLDMERAEKRLAHWKNIAIAACAQSGQKWMPQIDPVCTLPQALGRFEQGDSSEKSLVWYADPNANCPLAHYLAELKRAESLACFIGPESGFSSKELASFEKLNLAPLSFGQLVLRTETAGLAWLAGISALIGVK